MRVGSEKPEYKLALPKGTYGYVRFARTRNGEEPAYQFWEKEMSIQQQAAFLTLFRMIVSQNTLRLTNKQKFKQVEGDLFEFKSVPHQMRIFCFRDRDSWYLTSGFGEKKEDNLPAGVVKRAIEIMEDCQAELASFLKSKAVLAQRAANN